MAEDFAKHSRLASWLALRERASTNFLKVKPINMLSKTSNPTYLIVSRFEEELICNIKPNFEDTLPCSGRHSTTRLPSWVVFAFDTSTKEDARSAALCAYRYPFRAELFNSKLSYCSWLAFNCGPWTLIQR